MAKRKINKKKSSKKRKLTDEEKAQRQQEREIRNLLKNIGFERINRVNGKEFTFNERTSELDDIFYFENIILLTEYTISKKVGEHLLKKIHFYNKVNENKTDFIKFLFDNNIYPDLNEKFENNKFLKKYSLKQLQISILYCSKNTISQEHKNQATNVVYFDYHIVKYFESIAKVIKKSTKYEFFSFLNIPFNKAGEEILKSEDNSSKKFSGHILPEEHSSFKEGYKIVSFYIDAKNLLKRSYVLRQNDWRQKDIIGHYQRMFIQSKIKSMRKYLHEKKRVFINNIIATISTDKIKLYDQNENEIIIDKNGNFNTGETKVTPAKIEIVDETNIIGIIDGQHRTFAYHEGDDVYEETIKEFRNIQNLLVTGILYPQKELKEKKLKFEANLFMEINATQSGASSQLKQEIELMINPFSSTSIAKKIIENLNKSGPLSNLLEEYWYEKGKLKTASIVSFGLKPLIKIDDEKSKDSIFSIWNNENKNKLKEKNTEEYELLNEYIDFATEKIRDIMIAFKDNLDSKKWKVDRNDSDAILTVTTINGIFNALRKIIENNQNTTFTIDEYKELLRDIDDFNFKQFKSSQYRKMGEDLYQKYLSNKS